MYPGVYLEALAVDNRWAALIILLLGDPHLLEGGEGSKDGSSDPDRVLPLWWSNDLDLDGGWCKGSDLLLHTVSNSRVHGELTSSKIKTHNSMGKGIAFIDGDTVGDTISRVHDNTSGTARGIEGEDSLDGNIHGGHVEGLEHDLGHLLTVSLWVEGSLSEEDGLFLRRNTELIVEGVVPDLLHIIPVGDDSVLNGVLEGEDTSLGLGLISNIGILLSHTNHHTLVTGTPNNGGEDSTGSIVSSKSSLAHAGAIVNN